MTQIVLQYDTSLTGNLTQSITAQLIDISCEVVPQKISEFALATGGSYVTQIGRYAVDIVFSLENWENDQSVYVNIQKWIIAPVRRFHIITGTSLTSINGYTEFNSSNTANWIVDSSTTNYATNRRYRTLSVSLISESPYTI